MACSADIDLSHHLSAEARARKPNPMKEIWKLTKRRENMISLANGDPHSSLYPISQIQFEVASVDPDCDPVSTWRTAGPSAPSQLLTSTREPSSSCTLPVRTALQYTTGAGLPDAQAAVTALTRMYHRPPTHPDTGNEVERVATLTLGNGDAVTKLFRLLGEPGDHFLADEFTFSSLAGACVPQGVRWVPLRIDDGGLIPEDLDRTMSEWDDRRGRKPHVLYIVPCGQNPTGSMLTVERRKRIYKLAQKHDLIIVEDDPYYFLQYSTSDSSEPTLVPSFLSLDVDGRVMRVDSFSKILAPGMRLGWITSSPFFHRHLVILTDSSTQHPHAFGQMFITELLGPHGWTLDGFGRWVSSLRAEYQRRRDYFLELFEQEVVRVAPGLATPGRPQAGMFVWTRISVERHPRYRVSGTSKRGVPRTNCKELMEELFERCLDGGLVVMPAWVFALPCDPQLNHVEDPIEDRMNYFRLTFAGTEEAMQQGLAVLGRTLKEFFADEPVKA